MRKQSETSVHASNSHRVNDHFLALISRGMIRSGKLILLGGAVAFALAFMLLPALLVVLFSFNGRSIMAFPFKGPTLCWYAEAFRDGAITHGLRNSLIVGFAASTLAVMLRTEAAIAVARAGPRLATALSAVLTLLMLMPLLILSISLATLFAAAGTPMSVWTAALGHAVLLLPLTFTFVAARVASFDWNVGEASRDLGAGPFYSFVHVVLPAIGPAIIGAIAIAVTFLLDEFVVTFFTIGIDHTLPTLLWSKLHYAIHPSVNEIGTTLVLMSAIVIVIGVRFGTVRL